MTALPYRFAVASRVAASAAGAAEVDGEDDLVGARVDAPGGAGDLGLRQRAGDGGQVGGGPGDDLRRRAGRGDGGRGGRVGHVDDQLAVGDVRAGGLRAELAAQRRGERALVALGGDPGRRGGGVGTSAGGQGLGLCLPDGGAAGVCGPGWARRCGIGHRCGTGRASHGQRQRAAGRGRRGQRHEGPTPSRGMALPHPEPPRESTRTAGWQCVRGISEGQFDWAVRLNQALEVRNPPSSSITGEVNHNELITTRSAQQILR